MKKFLRSIIIFFIPLGITLFILEQYDNLDKNYSNNPNIIRIKNIPNNSDLDMLFIGNSYCYSGIIPSKFMDKGIHTYNLGIATAGPLFYEVLLEDYKKTAKQMPSKIVLFYSPMTFTSQSDNWNAYSIHRYLNYPLSNESLFLKTKNLNLYFKLLLNRSKKALNDLMFSNIEKSIKKPASLDNGYLKDTTVFTEKIESETKKLYDELKNDKFDYNKFDRLINLINEYENDSTEVILLEVPTFKLINYLNHDFNEDYKTSKQILHSMNIKLFENKYNDKFKYKHFRNIDHLNHDGAMLFTELFLNKVREDEKGI